MIQKAEIFFHDIRKPHALSIDALINNYISEHPEHKIACISYTIGGSFEKALVIFDVKEEKDNNERGRQNSQTSTYISKPDRKGSTSINKQASGMPERRSDI